MKGLLSDGSNALTRRRFLQSSILATAGVLGLPQQSQAAESQASSMGRSSNPFKGKRPNFLILMCLSYRITFIDFYLVRKRLKSVCTSSLAMRCMNTLHSSSIRLLSASEGLRVSLFVS